MRHLLIAALLLLSFPVAAGAVPCVSGALADYLALGSPGCTVSDLRFTNFSYEGTRDVPDFGDLPATDVNVVLNPADSPLFGSAIFEISSPGWTRANIGFDVRALGRTRLTGESLFLADGFPIPENPGRRGDVVLGTNTGLATWALSFNTLDPPPDPEFPCEGTGGEDFLFEWGCADLFDARSIIPGVRSLHIELTADSWVGSLFTFHYALDTAQFNVPEPAATTLMLLGAAGIVVWRRQRM